MSILDPLTCGFVKVYCYGLFQETNATKSSMSKMQKGGLNTQQFQKFNEYFRERNYIVDYKIFTENFILTVKNTQSLIKRYKDHQVQILDTFSKKNWEKLSLNKKNAHSLFNCNGCLQDTKLKGTLGLFPVRSVAYKQKLKENGLLDDKILCDVTNKTIKKLDVEFKANFNTTFSGQIKKKINNIVQKEKIKTAKALKVDIENQWKETSIQR